MFAKPRDKRWGKLLKGRHLCQGSVIARSHASGSASGRMLRALSFLQHPNACPLQHPHTASLLHSRLSGGESCISIASASHLTADNDTEFLYIVYSIASSRIIVGPLVVVFSASPPGRAKASLYSSAPAFLFILRARTRTHAV